jgi:glycosyltransferase involved in cell wall biosynthesis
MTPAQTATSLVVFADDWGRHPSSCQHLVRQLADRYPTLWVNTIGTRRPTRSKRDLGRVLGKLRSWAGLESVRVPTPANVVTVSPVMYPGFRTDLQRRLNTWQMAKAVQRYANLPGWRGDDEPVFPRLSRRRIAVTTLPITAGLVKHSRRLGIDQWMYYCVDNLAVWPGLDGHVMAAMEFELALDADKILCASEHLRQRLATMGRDDAATLTHGIDLDHWSHARAGAVDPQPVLGDVHPKFMFFGLIDPRLDMKWALSLGESRLGTLWLVGPSQPGAIWWQMTDHLRFTGAVAYDQLPGVAMRAKVLVMPYADVAVTRAMQPLKLLEYMATGWPDAMRPVVVRDLPATRAWADCCDVVCTPQQFVEVCRERERSGLPESQRQARLRRLPGESWASKAQQFEEHLTRPIADAVRGARHAAADRSIRPRTAA